MAVAPLTAPHPVAGRSRTPAHGGAHVLESPLRVTLLAQNLFGWARLSRLVSAAHAAAGDGLPVVSWPDLRAYADGDLVVPPGPSAEPMRALSPGRPDIAERLLAPWREFAGDRLRLKAVHLGLEGTGAGSCGWRSAPWAWATNSVPERSCPTRSSTLPADEAAHRRDQPAVRARAEVAASAASWKSTMAPP